ncbi:ABC transporter permease [Longibaculum muris]|uniref:ABC transporter permease n=1 Tax=Longibaculum muris TaxID=1796628 RepID=UPI002942EED3|nr:ABC transporter permease [Longibaculum muris]
MFKSMNYVLKENFNNLYRIYSISKYELLADMRDSKLGLFWNFANPVIQVLTYWFMFGLVFKKKNVGDISYLPWMLGGMVVWFFISPCITNGCNAIYAKRDVITKMKFPISVLPATVVLKELFNHVCLMIVVLIIFLGYGIYPTLQWVQLIYYLFCGIVFAVCLSLTTSVLNMLARDTRKLILACMRLLLYVTPVLWSLDQISGKYRILKSIIKINPIYYVVQGYRDCFFYHYGVFHYWKSALAFWVITLVLFAFGSFMMYKFKHKFIDMI